MVSCSAWGRQAETCNQYLSRGSKVLVEGRLTADPETGGPRLWQAQDGGQRASFEVSANLVQFLSTRAEDEYYQESQPAGQVAGAQVEEEEIPF